MRLAADADEVRRVHAALAAGSAVLAPVEEAFWSAAFGAVRDPHSITWLIAAPR